MKTNRNVALSRVLLLLSLNLGVVWPMTGGGNYQPTDFAFLVFVKNGTAKTTVCLGLIDNEIAFITAAQCLVRVRPGVHQSVASAVQPSIVVPIEEVDPGKLGDAPSEGKSPFPEPATVIARAKLPGMKIRAANDIGSLSGNGPTYTPWPMDEINYFATNITGRGATGIVAGMGNKAATMKALSDEECDKKLMGEVPGGMNSFLNWYESLNIAAENGTFTRDYFCADQGTEGGRFPPGYPCATDLGAPFIVDGFVWGVLIGAWCNNATSHVALFRTDTRTWIPRRFDGSLTEMTPFTRPKDSNFTSATGIFTPVMSEDETGTKATSGDTTLNDSLEPLFILTIAAVMCIEILQRMF